MKMHDTKHLISASLLCMTLFFSSQALAGKIIYMSGAIEADRVEYIAGSGSVGARIKASGCKECPLVLNVDANTKFFYQGKPTTMRRITFLSGKPGTVIYDEEQQRVIRVRW